MIHAKRFRRGFTLVELLVVIGIIAVLIGILLPALSKARKAAALAKCLANHKQLVAAMFLYANDNQGYLPYCGAGDVPNSRRATVNGSSPYSANWLFDPMQLANGTAGPFITDDIKTGALYPYLDTTKVFACPLADPGSEANPQYFQYLTSYVMNMCLSNSGYTGSYDGGTPQTRLLHKVSQFKAAGTVVYWDFPMSSTIGEGGTVYGTGSGDNGGATQKGPSSMAVARPSISGRHAGIKNTDIPANDTDFIHTVQGVIPVSFLDGHAEAWPMYTFYDNFNEAGPDAGASAFWVAYGDPGGRGGWDGSVRSMDAIIGSN